MRLQTRAVFSRPMAGHGRGAARGALHAAGDGLHAARARRPTAARPGRGSLIVLFLLSGKETGCSVLSFLSGKETGCSVLSFLSEKEKKEPKKRNLIGEGMGGSNRATLPLHPLPIFPCGAFLKEKPRKIFFAGKVSSADGRAQRADPSGFLSFLFGSFSFTERKRTKKKNPQNIFAGEASSADGRAQRLFASGFMAFFSGSLFASGKKREQTKTGQRAVI